MSFLSFSTIMIFLEQHVRLPHTCAPERSIYLTGNREKFQSNKKVPCITLHNTRDVCSTRFHPGYPSSCHLPATRTAKTGSSDLSFDGNGLTGPDWGRSELVFNCFRQRCSQHLHLSLLPSGNLLVSSTLFLISLLF